MNPKTCIILTFLLTLDAIAAGPVAAQPGLGACWMGETRDGTGGYFGEFERGFVVHLWMDPAVCGSCDGRIELRTIEFQVAPVLDPWPLPFDFPATVSVIGWSGTLECPVPDESVVLVPPRAITFGVTPVHSPNRTFARAPFGPSPPLVSPAFLKLEFPVAPSGSIPCAPLMVVSVTPCTTCRQYHTAPTWPGQPVRNLADACDISGHAPYALRGRADCVWVTPTRSTSWGQLKVFYR